MSASSPNYDPRYLAGIQFFNARDFFEAHEVWEELWGDTAGPDRRFYQALIQAAVALFHFGNGNVRGAHRLYHSSYNYMKPYLPFHEGLDVEGFWRQMGACFAAIAGNPDPPSVERDDDLIPRIVLNPAPESWPDPEQFLREDKPDS